MADVIIITTGDELLYGTTVDTNSSYIAKFFFGTNYHVKKCITVSDSIADIESAVRNSISEADVIITTGGLGPTDDDNTVEAICRITGTASVIDPWHRDKMLSFFGSMKMPVNAYDDKMVSYPEGAYVLKNTKGLAPGFIIELDKKLIISMPGVPPEMYIMFNPGVTDFVIKKYGIRNNLKLSYKISGLRESEINNTLKDIISGFDVKISITPKSGICDLVVVPASEDFSFAGDLNNSVKTSFGDYILDEGMDSPEEELVTMLKKRKQTLSIAESCTGGLVAKRITDIPGSSEVFTGSIVAYSNDLKRKILGVSENTLSQKGAVSEETALEMAYGLKSLTGSDICVSITGIAGPGGGTAEKPVGTVCFAFYLGASCFAITRNFSGNRDRVRTFASLFVFNFLRKELKSSVFLIEKNQQLIK